MARIAVVGSGIVGLATAARLARRGDEVLVLEKDEQLAGHQTGRNSGVVHSGLYYAPGSHKARMSRAGAESMLAYARERGIAHERTGKLVVATTAEQVPGLRRLARRAEENGIDAHLLSPAEAREHEPYVRAVEALRVTATGIIDYPAVCRSLADEVREHGGEVRVGTAVERATTVGDTVRLTTSRGEERVDALVSCAGLHSDLLARRSGLEPDARIVPFRGEYFELVPAQEHLVRGLVYPVPDPRFPFLGVHLTRSVHGGVHAGPNAVLALAREGYRWRDVVPAELAQSLAWPGLWRLAARNVVPGAKEMARSASRRLFAASLAQLVPGIRAEDLAPAPAGVRAQALHRDGSLVDDFLVESAPRQVHVLNAPSPAATAALEIAAHLERELDAAIG
ncbi:L-2-hydroxyglutarate oxidase [Cellulomonas phragmiteti]|uniref:L-2-hydroxyglutarate oxidase n=1 Tax=Cellulomonas phragmiteti TaxID=478780 RepID=UPI001EF3766E|nr:L-2-hydroxyglutarate oxidase [Cellulomonas phragmiteti]